MARDFSVTAIIAAYNEADLIGQVIAGMWAQGVSVYLIDHGSTDDTVAEAEKLRGAGLIGLERFPEESGFPSEDAGRFAWDHLLRRKEALALELPASWFLHSDADEFRESPWRDVDLREAIRRVDELGYNAIDFAVYNFWPTHDRFRRGDDVRKSFPLCERGAYFDKLQVKCWKRTGSSVDLASTGGHEARFPGRKVFPIRFLLRHYPIRGQAHGERKIFRERKARFVAEERARSWHMQYEEVIEGQSLLRDPASLAPFDPEAARLEAMVAHRGVEEEAARHQAEIERLGQELAGRSDELAAARARLAEREQEMAAVEERARGHEGAAGEAQVRIATLSAMAAEAERAAAAQRDQLAARDATHAELRATLETRDAAHAALVATLQTRDAALDGLRAECAALAQEIERLRQAERSATDESAQARANLALARQEQGELHAALDGARARVELTESTLRRCEEERRALVDESAVERGRLLAEQDHLRSERDQLRDDRDQLRSEREQLRAERDQIRGERDRWRAEHDQLHVEHGSVRVERDRLHVEHGSLRVERDQLHVEREPLRTERDQLRAEREQLRAERDQLRAERDQLRGERDPLRAERDHLRAEIDAHRRERAAFVDERHRLEERAVELERRCAEARGELAQAVDQLNGAEARIDAFYASRTWRWLAPARIAWKLVGKE